MSNTWWNRLKAGLKKSSTQVGDRLRSLFVHRKVDADLLDELEDLLIQADMGATMAQEFRCHLESLKLDPETASQDVIDQLVIMIQNKLTDIAKPLTFIEDQLNVVMMVGVNGAGKTTTIGKLIQKWQQQGLRVEVAACDTFRAAATEQLAIWAKRAGVVLYEAPSGHDPSGLAYDAVKKARDKGVDVLVIDTAGRLHNKDHLMDEMQKMQRVMKKIISDAPHHVILVLDATTGQNALMQTDAFKQAAHVTGLIITKLDGTAKGGVVLALSDRFGLPIHAIGVGESADDLEPFTPEQFAKALIGAD